MARICSLQSAGDARRTQPLGTTHTGRRSHDLYVLQRSAGTRRKRTVHLSKGGGGRAHPDLANGELRLLGALQFRVSNMGAAGALHLMLA
jgi:hypothetical protein